MIWLWKQDVCNESTGKQLDDYFVCCCTDSKNIGKTKVNLIKGNSFSDWKMSMSFTDFIGGKVLFQNIFLKYVIDNLNLYSESRYTFKMPCVMSCSIWQSDLNLEGCHWCQQQVNTNLQMRIDCLDAPDYAMPAERTFVYLSNFTILKLQ